MSDEISDNLAAHLDLPPDGPDELLEKWGDPALAAIAGKRKSADEVFESLSGFDEIAVAEGFEHSIAWFAANNETLFLRGLLFVELTRNGKSKIDARNIAMTLPLGKVNKLLETEDEQQDIIPGEPESEQGKGDWPPLNEPRI